MDALERSSKSLGWWVSFVLSALAAGCAGGRNPILGAGGDATLAPKVTAVAPIDATGGVPLNIAVVSAVFSEPMTAIAGDATFTLACAAPCANPTGTVSLDATQSIARFTLTRATQLEPLTLYTARLSGAHSAATGIALASPYVWHFTTGAAADTVAPIVSSTSPLANDAGVAINSLITASFSEAMNALTISSATFNLACAAGMPITGTVAYAVNGNVATFTPANNLPPRTICTATIAAGVEDVANNVMVNAFSWSFTTGVAADTTAPTVSSTGPVAGGGGVAINTSITASFSEPMDPLTITAAQFTLACPAGTPITGTVGYAVNGNVATFTSATDLPASTVCAARVATGVKDIAGNAMVTAVSWSFTTGATPDITAPTVSSTSPAVNVTGVAFNTLITASFSELMNPLTVTTASFTVACPTGTPITGTVGYAVNGNVATFTPASDLPASTICTARIGTGVTDVAHNAMATAYSWTFTTGVTPDTTAPTVNSTNPFANDTGIVINSLITASFSEPMNPLTVTTTNFTLACPAGTAVAGTVGYAVSGNIATFTPVGNLPASTTCMARIATGVEDVADNALVTAVSWTFSTAAAPDITAPTVSSTSPAVNVAGVAINALITASFSEAMNPLTVTTSNFTLACPTGTPITGTVGYAVNGSVATFTPASSLPASMTCTAHITTDVEDVAGNAMVNSFSWTFTTGVAPDATAPTVSSTSPVASDSGVAINTLVTASFSEPMDPLTVTTASFTLACPSGSPITGTVGYAVNGNVATFTPASDLPASTICTARIATGVTDVAHNAMAGVFSWTFTTGVAPDTTVPTVESTNPVGSAVGVCINKTINATFSEPMDPLTITTATFTLAVTAGASITGVVAYDALTDIATFDPTANLTGTPATQYTATLKGGVSGVKDLAGNALAADKVTTFTTNASTCTTAPALGAAAPFGGFGGSATLTNDGVGTVINGNIGVNAASTTITGLHDSGGNVYTITPDNNGLVNGLIYTSTAPPGSVPGDAVTQARAAALAAFNSISPATLTGGINMASLAQCPSCGGAADGANELAGRTLPPGVYLSATGTFDLGGAGHAAANLTLDAGGDTNAVWVFQTTPGTGTLNVGLTGPATPAVPIQVLLINGAQPKNIFWYVPAGAVIGTGSTVVGTLLSNAAITMSTTGGSPPTAVITTLNGRAIALTAAVTMTNAVINVPAP